MSWINRVGSSWDTAPKNKAKPHLYQLLAAFLLILIFVPVFSAAIAEQVPAELVQVPMVEAREQIARWAGKQGCTVTESHADTNSSGWIMVLEGGPCGFSLVLVPDSLFATRITMYPGKGLESSAKEIFSSLLAVFRGEKQEAVQAVEPTGNDMENGNRGQTPDEKEGLLARYGPYSLCMMIYQEHGYIQVSGLFLPGIKAIVTTAHDIGSVKSVAVTMKDGKELAGRIVNIDRERDLALVKVDEVPASSVSEHVPWRTNVFSRGERIFAMGCPLHRGIVLREGIVEGPRNMNGQILWQVHMDVEPGSSGSPVFDNNGNLAGLMKGRLKTDHREGFVIPVDTLREFLECFSQPGKNRFIKYRLPIFRGLN